MPVEILMPELGEGVHEGTVSRWLKKEGDFVKEDEPVVEIMTDKVNTELQAPASGVLVKILIPEGSPVEVFHAMGLIEESNGAAKKPVAETPTPAKDEPKPEPKTETTVETTSTAPVASGDRKWYTPVVRAMSKELGISDSELAGISGTGQGGRVTKRDVEAYLARRTGGSSAPVTKIEVKDVAPVAAGPDQEIVPLAGMRKMIAEAMVRSSAVPTVSTLAEVDVTNMVKFRERNKDSFPEQFGVKLTYTPFFIKAITETLQEFPLVNASLQGDQIVMSRAVHMGVAVSLGEKGDQGLIVPVIRDCQSKTLIGIAKDLETIAARARSSSLSVADVQGGTFTLTNPGSYGAVLGTPMINAPQAAILGTYTIKKMPIIVDEMIGVRSIMNLVLTYDHRLIDGLLAGRFLQRLKQKLETFDFFK
ncbi:MAG TPA: dihydrolipoamide acetyltransferase family protein [Fimbriimonadaceae bacterium]|nr:dihydrolipoamide acetyltransferase family protein [Fimbriimonadaceae bacterium]